MRNLWVGIIAAFLFVGLGQNALEARWVTKKERVCGPKRECATRPVTVPRCTPYNDCKSVPQQRQRCTTQRSCRTVYDNNRLCQRHCQLQRQASGQTTQNCQNVCNNYRRPRQVCTPRRVCHSETTYRHVCQMRSRCTNVTENKRTCRTRTRCWLETRRVHVPDAPSSAARAKDAASRALETVKTTVEGVTAEGVPELAAKKLGSVIEEGAATAVVAVVLKETGAPFIKRATKVVIKNAARSIVDFLLLVRDIALQSYQTGVLVGTLVDYKMHEFDLKVAVQVLQESTDLYLSALDEEASVKEQLAASGEDWQGHPAYLKAREKVERLARRYDSALKNYDEIHAFLVQKFEATRANQILAEGTRLREAHDLGQAIGRQLKKDWVLISETR